MIMDFTTPSEEEVGQEAEASLWVGDAPLHELQVGEVLLRVGVEEALGVVAGVQQDLVHLLIEEAPLVGNLHGQAVALLGIDDASRRNLGLQQADPVVLQDQTLLHGLEEGDELSGVGIPVASDCPLSGEQLVLELGAHDAHPYSFLHCQLEALDGVNHVPRGRLRLQELKGGAWPDDTLLHGLVDGQPLLRGVHIDASNAAGALQEFLQVLGDLLDGAPGK
ncbi:hypothetical protein llap_18779 [Limosa lapponica baueri]|uniref:Uncharacterized protein n=1 Tax=Limosa lapponica baueri TaxID=1758121 RepID=A0A2I0TAU0_LIMLA|nr:hypothetical protein llap_18779 [Limosa lapponica baueri]